MPVLYLAEYKNIGRVKGIKSVEVGRGRWDKGEVESDTMYIVSISTRCSGVIVAAPPLGRLG
jgi:hypothetical protein